MLIYEADIKTLVKVHPSFTISHLLKEVDMVTAGEDVRIEKFYALLTSPKLRWVGTLVRLPPFLPFNDTELASSRTASCKEAVGGVVSPPFKIIA